MITVERRRIPQKGDIVTIDYDEIELYESNEFRSEEERTLILKLSIIEAEGVAHIEKGGEFMVKFKRIDIQEAINHTLAIDNIRNIEHEFPHYFAEGLELYRGELIVASRPSRFTLR